MLNWKLANERRYWDNRDHDVVVYKYINSDAPTTETHNQTSGVMIPKLATKYMQDLYQRQQKGSSNPK